MKIRIDVTDDDIRRGTPQSGNGCAVYTTVKRAGLDVVNVTQSRITLRNDARTHEPSEEVRHWIRAYDSGGKDNGKCQPFTFEFDSEEDA